MSPAVDPLSPVTLATLAAGIGLVALAGYLLGRRDGPGVALFVTSLSAQALWCLAYGLGLATADPALRAGLETVAWVGIAWTAYPFLGFALEYTGRGRILRSRTFAALAVQPVVTTLLVVTASEHAILWGEADSVVVFGAAALDYTIHPVGVATVVAGMAYTGVGVLLLAETILSYGPLYRTEALAVGVSTVPPLAGVLVWLLDLGAWSVLNWGAILSLPHVVFDAYAFVGNDMFETSPATRRVADREAIDAMADPVVVLDERRRLIDYNERASTTFGAIGPETVGEPVDDLLPVTADDVGRTGERYASATVDDRRREFKLRATPLANSRGETVGHTLQLQDVTEEREREQRLSVLNRVLRHNLRNELTVINGYAGRIERTADGPVADHADRIARSGERLADIGEKARAFDSLVGDDPTFEAIDLAAFLSAAAGEFRGRYPAATVRTRCDDVDLVADRALLRAALANVVENALEHGGEAPAVEIGTRVDPSGWVVVTVVDDGPGIPEAEVSALDEGRETELDHGSGIGLWIVEWCLRRVGGRLTFDRDGADGETTVGLWLPVDAERSGSAGPGAESEATGKGTGTAGDGGATGVEDRPNG